MNDLIDLDLDLKNMYCVYSSSSEETTVEEYQHNNISVTIENTFSGAYISIDENYTNYPVVVSYMANMLDNNNQDFDISTDYLTNNINFNIRYKLFYNNSSNLYKIKVVTRSTKQLQTAFNCVGFRNNVIIEYNDLDIDYAS